MREAVTAETRRLVTSVCLYVAIKDLDFTLHRIAGLNLPSMYFKKLLSVCLNMQLSGDSAIKVLVQEQ